MTQKSPIRSVTTRSAAVLALVAIGIAEATAAGMIGINFTDSGEGNLGTSEIAGAVPQDFFNNVGGVGFINSTGLLNDDGLETTVSMVGNPSNGDHFLGTVPVSSDAKFMDGYWDVTENPVTLNFSNLNSLTDGQAYSVLVYTDGDGLLRRGQFELLNATTGNAVYFTEDNGDFPINGTTLNYVRSLATTDTQAEALTGINNYVRFDGVTGNSFSIRAFGSGPNTDALRAPINGIQIVTVPEPSTLLSLVGSVGMLLSLRRRTR